MSVYTIIETGELEGFLSGYSVGALRDFDGISDGIDNTNYFVNTDNDNDGRFILTLLEHHTLEEMQYYLGLMHHLADEDACFSRRKPLYRNPGVMPICPAAWFTRTCFVTMHRVYKILLSQRTQRLMRVLSG